MRLKVKIPYTVTQTVKNGLKINFLIQIKIIKNNFAV